MLAEIYGNWTVPDYSVHGGKIDDIIDIIHVFMLVIFVPWATFFIYCLAKYRRRENGKALYFPIKAKISKYGEIGVALFEVILLLMFSVPVWAEYKNKPPAQDKRLEVHVFAEQFQWDFHYPGKDGIFGKTDPKLITASNVIGLVESDPAAADDIVRVNEFHIPVETPIYIKLRSKDVIHSFDIPTMRVKQDVIPGMEIPIWFEVKKDGLTELVKKEMTREYSLEGADWYKLRHLVAAEDVTATKGGEVLLAKGADLGLSLQKGEETIKNLRTAGVTKILLQPRNPLEVVCAQLCGNSHFKMKAQLYTHTPEQFTAWVAEASKKVELKEDF